MRESLCRDKIMREEMNIGTMRKRNRKIFVRAGANAVIDAGHTVHERLMSRLWADYERVVIPTKREAERIAERTKEKNDEERRRQNLCQGGGERNHLSDAGHTTHERIMSRLWMYYERMGVPEVNWYVDIERHTKAEAKEKEEQSGQKKKTKQKEKR